MIIFSDQSGVLTRQNVNDDVTKDSSLVCQRVAFLREDEQCVRACTSVDRVECLSPGKDRAEGGAGRALAPPLFCKNKNKLNKK